MHVKYTPEFITAILAQHAAGTSVAELITEYSVPRSTIYHWIKKHYKLPSSVDSIASYKDYINLQRRCKKLESRLAVLKDSGCGLSAPLSEKLTALENLYYKGCYTVHALCDAL